MNKTSSHIYMLLLLCLLSFVSGCSPARSSDHDLTEAETETIFYNYDWMETYEFEEVQTETADAGFYLSGTSQWNNTLIFAASEGSDGMEVQRYTEIFHDGLGYHILIVDGRSDTYDSWITYIGNRTGDEGEIVLAAMSSTALTALRYTSADWSDSVSAVIADSPLTADDEACEFLDPLLAAGAIPVLFIYSRTDEYQEQDIYQQLYTRYAGIKEMYLISEAAHAGAWQEDADLYERRVTQFVNNYMNDGINASAICCDPDLEL